MIENLNEMMSSAGLGDMNGTLLQKMFLLDNILVLAVMAVALPLAVVGIIRRRVRKNRYE